MNTKKSAHRLLIILLFVLSGFAAQAQKVRIQISGIQSANGKIVISIFKNDETFKEEKPFKRMTFEKKGIVNGALVLDIALEPGTYGLALLDDKNEDGKMDKNMVGIPKEGFGFSNFFLQKMKRPSFEEFKVAIKPGENNVNIKVKYM